MNRLTSPALGLNRYTNAMATRNGGVMYAIVAVRWMKRLPGTSVRVDRPGHRQPDGHAEDGRPAAEHEQFHRAVDVEPAAQRAPEVLERGAAVGAHAAPRSAPSGSTTSTRSAALATTRTTGSALKRGVTGVATSIARPRVEVYSRTRGGAVQGPGGHEYWPVKPPESLS